MLDLCDGTLDLSAFEIPAVHAARCGRAGLGWALSSRAELSHIPGLQNSHSRRSLARMSALCYATDACVLWLSQAGTPACFRPGALHAFGTTPLYPHLLWRSTPDRKGAAEGLQSMRAFRLIIMAGIPGASGRLLRYGFGRNTQRSGSCHVGADVEGSGPVRWYNGLLRAPGA